MPKNELYPKEFRENLKYRLQLIRSAENNPLLQVQLKEQCRRDRLFFYNTFVWTYDPRTSFRKLPFITYPFQDDVILWDADCGINQEDSGVEKSRDMGATWMFTVNDVYDWLFTQTKIETLWGSRKEDYVDKRGDMDSIFEKIRYVVENLPVWMLPTGYNSRAHATHMRLINPATGSAIIGEATNSNFGRGGRKYRIRFDEFAFWGNEDKAAWEGAADCTNARCCISTPNGSSNKSALLLNGEIKNVKTIHWTLHPKKTRGLYYLSNGMRVPIDDKSRAFEIWRLNRGVRAEEVKGGIVRSIWYDSECERRTAQGVAQELDIDYLMSGSPFFDLVAVNKQVAWKEVKLMRPGGEIRWGTYIRVNLVEHNGKVEIRESHNGWLKLFEYPRDGYQYCLGSDTSEGLPKGDESYAIIKEKTTYNVVATIQVLVPPETFAYYTWLAERFFNGADNAPENNNNGYTTALELHRYGSNLYYTKRDTVVNGSARTIIKRGWTTTSTTRPQMLNIMASNISSGLTELRDPELIAQCKTFIRNKRGKPEADGDFHDDAVLACAICDAVIEEKPYKPRVIRKRSRAEGFERRKMQNAGIRF